MSVRNNGENIRILGQPSHAHPAHCHPLYPTHCHPLLHTMPPSLPHSPTCTSALTLHLFHSSSPPTTAHSSHHHPSPLSLPSLPTPPPPPGRETSAREVYLVLGVVMIPVLYFAGAGGTVFWIIGEDRAQPTRPTLVTPSPPPPPPRQVPLWWWCCSTPSSLPCQSTSGTQSWALSWRTSPCPDHTPSHD